MAIKRKHKLDPSAASSSILSASESVDLTQSNLDRLERLQKAPRARSFSHVSVRNQAAVAALLYQGNDAELRVVMTTRAMHLRSHPGQASLPGGKMDSTDRDVAHTALRESCEEVGLHASDVVHLHTAEPFLSKTSLLVHPVVFYLRGGEATVAKLVASPSEVGLIWSVPLEPFLSSTAPPHLVPHFADPTTVDTHRPPQCAFRTFTDVPWISGSYRLHRFRSQHQLVKGLTADVLIYVASVAFGRRPAFQDMAPDQIPWNQMVNRVLDNLAHGQRGGKRWGDGESGDAYGSSEAFATHVGVDL